MEVDVFFSSIEDLARVNLLRFTVDWDYIRARTVFIELPARETGLEEVSEVLPGERITVQAGN